LKDLKNDCPRFFSNLLLLLLIIIICDQLTGRILKHLYFSQKSGLFFRTTYAIDSTKANIIVFGSSRANHHYVPEIFEDSLNLSFYNSGREGNFLLYNYAVFKAIVKRHRPEIVIFDVIPNELFYEKESYERLSSLLPYYTAHPEIRDVVQLKSSLEKLKILSGIYPYNSSLITVLIGNLDINSSRKGDDRGFVPLHKSIKDTVLHTIELVPGIIDNNKINALTDIINYCDSDKIRLVFIQSPLYAIFQETGSMRYFDKLEESNKIIYWDFSNEPEIMSHPGYFQDQFHLNLQGAECFSKLLVRKIRENSSIQSLTAGDSPDFMTIVTRE
jgi:hypothetical protein